MAYRIVFIKENIEDDSIEWPGGFNSAIQHPRSELEIRNGTKEITIVGVRDEHGEIVFEHQIASGQ